MRSANFRGHDVEARLEPAEPTHGFSGRDPVEPHGVPPLEKANHRVRRALRRRTGGSPSGTASLVFLLRTRGERPGPASVLAGRRCTGPGQPQTLSRGRCWT